MVPEPREISALPSSKSVRRLLMVPALSLLLAACSVGPDYTAPDFLLPESWNADGKSAQVTPPQLANWWKTLSDPTLNALMDEAVANNLDVATARARVREARASYRQQVGSLFPAVDGSASYTRGDNGSRTGTDGVVERSGVYSQYQAGLDASWELDLFGANRRAVEAERYGAQAAEDDLRATLLTLVGDVATNYVTARGYQARIVLAKRTAATQRETAELTRTRMAAGAVSAVDAANAAGQAASTEATIPELEAVYAQTVHRLAVLTGQQPSALNRRMARSRPIPVPRRGVRKGVPADVLRNRPDLRQAERDLAQSTALIGQAEAERYPSVSLTGNVSTMGTRIGDLARGSSISWAWGPTLTVPVFEGGQLKAQVEVREAQRDQSFLAYHAAVLTALEDVENASVALTQERRKAQKLTASAQAYRKAAELSHSLYRNGSTSFLEVLDAERSLYSAEDTLLQSRVAITTHYVALNKALGGGWDGEMDVMTPAVIDVNTGPHLPFFRP
ncbi:MAG: efflux transporter outer membrane subunit [Xanthobacter sp.]